MTLSFADLLDSGVEIAEDEKPAPKKRVSKPKKSVEIVNMGLRADGALVLPYPPSSNRYWRMVTVRGHARLIVSKEAKDYRVAVKEIAQQAKIRTYDQPVKVHVQVYRPQRRGDLDNTAKVLLDALRGLWFFDDEQIEELCMQRHESPGNGHVAVFVCPSSLTK